MAAHISGLAVGMLLYSNQRFWVIAFAAATAIASKHLFQVAMPTPNLSPETWPIRHFFNPSNFGITFTLLVFPWVGIAPPYQFTENVRGAMARQFGWELRVNLDEKQQLGGMMIDACGAFGKG